jgi:hypothetical protein
MKTSALALMLGTAVLLAGCQTAQSVGNLTRLDENTSFMNLWQTYKQCENGSDLTVILSAARSLNQAALQPRVVPAAFTFPQPIQQWVSAPPARLSVDPKSMAAACTLHAGQTALALGRHDLAGEMFRAVLAAQPGASPYYIEQARLGLARAILGVQASLISSPAPRTPSAPF